MRVEREEEVMARLNPKLPMGLIWLFVLFLLSLQMKP